MAKNDSKTKEQKTLELIREAVQFDEALRVKYGIGGKFRFVRDRLQNLLKELEESLPKEAKVQETQIYQAATDEILVYVHLYNVHGLKISSWQNLLTPKVLYEYSINRPIYREKKFIEAFIRQKTNKFQHGFITIAVKEKDILSQDANLKDSIGHSLIRVREGGLHFEKFISFTHNEIDYRLNADSELIKITAY